MPDIWPVQINQMCVCVFDSVVTCNTNCVVCVCVSIRNALFNIMRPQTNAYAGHTEQICAAVFATIDRTPSSVLNI